MKSANTETAKRLLTDIEINGHGLTKWENDFVDGLREKFEMYGDGTFVTDEQLYKLEQIAEQRC